MELLQLDPQKLDIDETNERLSGVGPHSDTGNLEDSISNLGVIQAIIVREVDGEYKVVAGQRRTMAAQAAGLDEVPAIVMDIDESRARAISIAENDESFNRQVSKDDRAKATKELVESLDSQSAAAQELGVNDAVISRRLERTREYWEETEVYWENDSDVDMESLSDDLIAGVRGVVDNPVEAERLIKEVIREKIPRNLIETAIDEAQTAEDIENNLDRLFHGEDVEETELEIKTGLSGSIADALIKYSKTHGTSPEKALRKLAGERLADQGYFDSREEQETKLNDFK